MMSNQTMEAVHYFKKGPFHKLLCAFRVKYEAIGEAVGTISTVTLTDEELLALADFMDMTEPALELRRSLSLARFAVQLDNRFRGVELQQLLAVYFNEPLQVKQGNPISLEQGSE